MFSQNPLEKLFGQGRQRNSGNFYIDIVDVIAAGKAQRTHQLIKHGITPQGETIRPCTFYNAVVDEEDVEMLHEITIEDTQTLVNSNETLNQKIISIAGCLVHKHGEPDTTQGKEETEFLSELNRGGLSLPTLNTVVFVHRSMIVHGKITEPRRNCCKYLKNLMSHIDTERASNEKICQTLTNIVYKAYVQNNSDRERELGCLRRMEKLSKMFRSKFT